MNNVRKKIQKELSLLGQDFKKIHISDILESTDFSHKVIDLDFLTYDYSKQRIDQKTLDYLFKIPDLINLKESLHSLLLEESVIHQRIN